MTTRFPDAPPQIAALPVEARGYPVPHFVSWIGGAPEFRGVDPRKIEHADKRGLCWICGRKLSGVLCFLVGPMCCANRVSSEPPSHLECARFAARACPFLTKPMAKRRDMGDIPHSAAPGLMLEHNPGVSALWQTRSYRTERQHGGGLLFRMGPAIRVEWFAEGRPATHDEVIAGFKRGLPALRDVARLDGPEGEAALARALLKAMEWVPQP